MGRYMGKLSAATRAKVVKLQHNWQNTGRQKGLFLASAGADQDDIDAATRCPMGCEAYEAPLHYLSCTKNPRMAEMKFGITEIKRWMQRQDAAPVLRTIVTRILHKVTQDKAEELEEWNFDNEREKEQYYTLIEDQAEMFSKGAWPRAGNTYRAAILKH